MLTERTTGSSPVAAGGGAAGWRRLASGPLVLVVAFCVNSGGVFLFHVIVSRLIGPSEYGALGALLALALIVSVASGAVTLAVTQRVAASPSGVGWHLGRQSRLIGAAGAGLAVVGLGGAPEIRDYLHLGSLVPVVLLLLFGEVVLWGLIPRGVLIGQHRYQVMATAVVAGAVVRVAVGAALARPYGTSGAIAGYTVAEVVTGAIAIWAVRSQRGGAPVSTELAVPWRSLGLAGAAFGGMWAFSATDTFLARHLLSSLQAGIYVSASVAGSAALWLPYNVTASTFGRLSAEAADESADSASFRIGLAATVGMAVVIAGVLVTAPALVIRVLFGASYAGAGPVLTLLAVSNGLQGVTGFVLAHQLAHRRRTVLLPWAGVGALVVGISLHHGTPRQIAAVAVATSAALVLAMLAGSVLILRPRMRRS